MDLIENIYEECSIIIRVNGPIKANKGIRQDDPLNPLLINNIIDEIIEEVKTGKEYKLGERKVKIICYVDDMTLVAESEDELQKLLMIMMILSCRRYNVKILTEKTKCQL